MEKYFELGRDAARCALNFVREMSEEASSLYLNAWDNGYRIGYPPRERLRSDFLESWLNHGHYAYFGFENSRVVGVALLAVEKPSSQLTIVEGCGAAIHPEYQQRGFGKKLSLMRVEKRREYFGEVIHVIGANYVSSGSQATSVRQDLDVTSLQLALYNNSPEAYLRENLDPNLAVSNGEVVFEGRFLDGRRGNITEHLLFVADLRMDIVLQKLGFRTVLVDESKSSKRSSFLSREDQFNGRIDYFEDDAGEVRELEEILQPDHRCKRLFVSSQNYAVQRELSKMDVLPVGVSFAHRNAFVYQVLPKSHNFPDLCDLDHCQGGCRSGRIGKIHTPFEKVKEVYRYLQTINSSETREMFK
ncbi:GNAT family N-acetyltransferase [Candidatus Woesearchaeota archaeon]|nr:GNAT family N-acetyltransferase [Candidatus Woesearchaeota archaeon]